MTADLVPSSVLRPRATVLDVLAGRASLVGARANASLAPGLVSPVEARVALGIVYDDLAAAEAQYLETRSWRRDLGVLVRSLIASVLASGGSEVARRPWIVSAAVDNVTIPEALDSIFAPAPADRARIVHYAHAHALTVARTDEGLRRAFAAADAVLPDGIGIRVAAAMHGVRMLDNVNGTDMLPLVCRRASSEGLPLVLVGGAPGVADACAENLAKAHPGLEVALVSHGFLDARQIARLVRQIRALGRCLVLVGMGSPIQERWAHEHLGALGGVTALTVGGLFDFYSGRIRRAPVALRELGLEWAYRLAQEPGRLARRYLLGNPRFLAMAMVDRLLGVRSAAPPRELAEEPMPASVPAMPASGVVRIRGQAADERAA